MNIYEILNVVGKLIVNEELTDEEREILNKMTDEEIEEWKSIYLMLSNDY